MIWKGQKTNSGEVNAAGAGKWREHFCILWLHNANCATYILTVVVAELRLAGRIFRQRQVHEKDEQDLGDHIPHADRPNGRHPSYHLLEFSFEIHRVLQEQVMQSQSQRTAVFLDYLVYKADREGGEESVEKYKADEAGPEIIQSKPQAARQNDGAEVGEAEADVGPQPDRLDLVLEPVDPAGGERLQESDQQEHEVDVEVERVQELKPRIGAHGQTEEETTRAEATGELPVRHSAEEGSVPQDDENALDATERRINAQQIQSEPKKPDPVNVAGERVEDDRPSAKH